MRKTFLLSLFSVLQLFPQLLLAQTSKLKELDILCITEYPTTSFISFQEGSRLRVRFVNSNGVGYMPIHSGLVTINDIETLKKRAEVLKNIADVNEFYLNMEDCEVFKDGTFRCRGRTSFPGVNGEQIKVFSLSSNKQLIAFSDYHYVATDILLGLEIDKETYFITMTYTADECGINYKYESRFTK